MFELILGILSLILGIVILLFSRKLAKWRLKWDTRIIKGAFGKNLKKNKLNLAACSLQVVVVGIALIVLGISLVIKSI